MKKSSILLLITLLIISLNSCNNEPVLPDDSHNFINQKVQGKIDGVGFLLGKGIYRTSDDMIFVEFFDDSEIFEETPCESTVAKEVSVTFRVPNEVGLYPLQLNLFNAFGVGQSVTLLNPDGNTEIATFGAIEILSIDVDSITGRIDARAEEGNSINGDFTINLCE